MDTTDNARREIYMEQLINITNYEDYKCALKKELLSAAEGFVRIGYLLKKARDTDILEVSGYSNVNEFAQKEFGLEKTQVSRFININERFADAEHPDQLKEQYKGFGVAKLSIMLTIPDNINEELTPEYSKSEIQAIKEEYDEEQKISDIERMIEPVPNHIAEVDSMLGKAIVELGEKETDLYEAIHYTANIGHMLDIEKLKDDMAPSEDATYSIRIPGVGRVMLVLKTTGVNTIVNMRSGEKHEYTWEEIADAWMIIIDINKNPKEDWEERYGKEWPKKEEVAPVQQKKVEPKKQSKVVRTEIPKEKKTEKMGHEKAEKTSEEKKEISQNEENRENKTPVNSLHDIDASIPAPSPIEEPQEPETEENGSNEEVEEQIPGQADISDYPEYMPEHRTENDTENTEIATKPDFEADMATVAADEQSELDMREEALELAQMVKDCIDGWQNEDEMPIPEINKCIENAQKCIEKLEELKASMERRKGE